MLRQMWLVLIRQHCLTTMEVYSSSLISECVCGHVENITEYVTSVLSIVKVVI